MKATLCVILLAATAAGLWQGSELSRLKRREAELRIGLVTGEAHETSSASKLSRVEAKPSLDGSAFVASLAAPTERGTPPTPDEREHLRNAIATGSGRELKEWARAVRESDLPEETKKRVFAGLAPRLAESDPRSAADLALSGGDYEPFRIVLRFWMAKDAGAAAAWLDALDPPYNPSRFRRVEYMESTGYQPVEYLERQSLFLAAKVAAGPAGMEELLGADSKTSRAVLGELAAFQAPADLAKVLNRFSRESGLPEDERLHLTAGALLRHRDPAMARQILLEMTLPPEQFRKAATTMIVSLDPIGIRSGVEWFRTYTAGETKAEGLRGIVATWARQDPKAAVEWVEGLSDAAEKADLQSVLPEPYRKP